MKQRKKRDNVVLSVDLAENATGLLKTAAKFQPDATRLRRRFEEAALRMEIAIAEKSNHEVTVPPGLFRKLLHCAAHLLVEYRGEIKILYDGIMGNK